MHPVRHHGGMFIIDCSACEDLGHQHRQLVTNRHLVSVRRSPEGPIATVRCVAGHEVEHHMQAGPLLAPSATC